MLIEVFGPGCAKCQTLEKHAKEAAEKSGGNHQVVKVSDYAAMVARGILSTPALALDGQLKFQGKVASSDEILALIKA
ncbi:MAG: TM0996/MTH895 family glutaredoxin-like protein [Holophagaceae bacterium]|jgi:small redox-active disulfide protein 2|uniref:TM0996/MTH895 family glutaredoxin-like protein n=1 Tax=Candidatus Geothrix odensensis TaxID=2954440 RepID=A0A936F0K9_9BACT|nr:TM0996/MTH895 family glutaredoxin-like protein [Candidatus Geothrix odensensis]MBK8790979.1 TM0996/MTH895 family glutaredoxin-like protein [Holophagaceae bacterium]